MAPVLVTGFPGFLAGRLIPRLIADGLQVVALVEPRMLPRARALAPAGVELLAGDITDPQLGLGAAGAAALAKRITAVFHLAAVYDLAVGAPLAERVNVAGTQHVLDLCRRAPGLERLHHVSTAYVAGRRSGLVLEDELAAGQRFKNHYESTKFASEVLVRGAMDEVPATVYRPAIVVGDSRTGETAKFDGPYYLLRFAAAMRGAPVPQIGRGDAPFNVVPVDFVVDAIATAAGDPAAAGATLHLVDPEPVSSAELFTLLLRGYAGRDPAFRISSRLVEESLRLRAVRRLVGGTPRQSIVYLNHPVRFDVGQAAAILGPHGLRCPRFGEYAGALVAFFRDHERDPALVPAAAG